MAYEITGPYSYGPQYMTRPIRARSPAGPRSINWPSRQFDTLQPQLGRLGFIWNPEDPYDDNGDIYTPPPVTTYAPYCGNVWLWVLGTAVVMLVLTQRGNGK